MDLHDLTDEQLNTLEIDVLVEKERRQRLASIPGQIATLRHQYVEGGGDLADLDAIPS